MINCPDCSEDNIFIIDSRVSGKGKYIRRRLECPDCGARFTSHELREADLTDSTPMHFSQILDKLRTKGRIPKPFRGAIKPKPEKVIVTRRWYQKLSPCCFESESDTVNY